jgi:RND family efflux transporter MFP subunit
MRTVEPTGHASREQASEELPSRSSSVDRLIEENLALKRQLEELKAGPPSHGRSPTPAQLWRPSSITIWAIILGVTVLLIVAFIAGYVPMRKQRGVIAGEALSRQEALPRAEVMQVRRAPSDSELELPGSIQAITEAPVLARASGYIKQRFGDIGDRVKAGQALAQIDAPELDQQVIEAKANLQQAHAVLDESNASYEQGKANLDLAKVSADRWKQLLARGVVSRQENDTYNSQYNAQLAGVRSLERAIAAQQHTVAASEANLSRLKQMQDFETVRAPFDGIITLRNVDSGTLVTGGTTLLFRIAQINVLRTYLNVPQTNSAAIHTGQKAALRVSSLPGVFEGAVARTANSLDPASRTLLVEVHVQNPTGALMPGMYAQVSLATERPNPPLLVPSDALIVRPGANLIAVLRPDHTVHLQTVEVGRDYGDRLEILTGLEDGATIIPIPGDLAREGLKIDPVERPRPPGSTSTEGTK